MPTSYGALRGKKATFHYKVKERDQIKTVLALTDHSALSCMTNIQFILQNRRFVTRENIFITLLMLQVSDLYLCDTYSSILLLELGRMMNGVLYPMDPFAQPIRFQRNVDQAEAHVTSIMSRIRIAVENGFAGQHNCFNFSSFKSGLKLGARNVAHIYMYMCATFYVRDFLHECTLFVLWKSLLGCNGLPDNDNRRNCNKQQDGLARASCAHARSCAGLDESR